jgi:uncharacterized protein (UPF0332 family)
MKLRDWLNSGDLLQQPATRAEVTRLLEVARRDLADVTAVGLSLDRRFNTAYEAAYTIATVVLRASGYRTRAGAAGHHWLTFAVLPEIMGEAAAPRARYYQSCRRKRHEATYEHAGVATEAEVDELVADANVFQQEVTAWLRDRHADLAPANRS